MCSVQIRFSLNCFPSQKLRWLFACRTCVMHGKLYIYSTPGVIQKSRVRSQCPVADLSIFPSYAEESLQAQEDWKVGNVSCCWFLTVSFHVLTRMTRAAGQVKRGLQLAAGSVMCFCYYVILCLSCASCCSKTLEYIETVFRLHLPRHCIAPLYSPLPYLPTDRCHNDGMDPSRTQFKLENQELSIFFFCHCLF